jgi:threonylcarbamoyladenosine tRNA methylthiotransferase MtaB
MKTKKVAFYTLGCKLNFAETSTISRFFLDEGFEIVKFSEIADFYVINTCSVTSNANKKSRNAIARAKLKNPNSVVIATGCYAQLKPEEIEKLHYADYIIGANDKHQINEILKTHSSKDISSKYITNHKEVKTFFAAFSKGDRTRSFLKVQDGCDYFCAYCTIPYARGRSRNLSIEGIIDNAKNIAKENIKEIILTGINIGDFGKSTNETFYDLLLALLEVKSIERIRTGSIEPNLLEDRIIHLIASEKKLMPHFHIPLQSGSNEMLNLIGRRYDTNLFRSKVETIKYLIPDAFIGIDLIVGLNGETEMHFNETYEFIKSLDISFIHHFQYSEREGTPAVNFTPKTSPQQKQKRAAIVSEISNIKHSNFLKKSIGTKHTVLFESAHKNGKIYGYTDNYIRVCTEFNKNLLNQIIEVSLIKFDDKDTLIAKAL